MIIIALSRPPDDSNHFAWPERHLDERTKVTAALGRFVIQRTAQRLCCQNTNKCTFVKKRGAHVRANL